MTVDQYGLPIANLDTTQAGDPGIRGREVFVMMNRLMEVEGSVTEFFDQEEWVRFLACDCPEFRRNEIYCEHIKWTYDHRLDVKERDEEKPNAVTIAEWKSIPFEVNGSYLTAVVIFGEGQHLTVTYKFRYLPDQDNDDFGWINAILVLPPVRTSDRADDLGTDVDLGIVPRGVGRGELRTLFIEWIMSQMEFADNLECKQEWHEPWDYKNNSLKTQITNAWGLITKSTCAVCALNPSIPQPYNPMEGALRRARQQSRSNANRG